MSIRNLEWLDQNSNRNYPIQDGLDRTDIYGFTLPNNIVVDALFCVNDINRSLYISSVSFLETNIIINIYDDQEVFVGNFLIDKYNHNIYDQYNMTGYGTYKYSQGKLVIGDLNNCPIGDFKFNIGSTKLETRVIVPLLKGIHSIQINEDQSSIVFGNVKLSAGFNFRLRLDKATNTIFFDAIEGKGLGPVCSCDKEKSNVYIKTINGVYPDSNDNINIQGVGSIKVETTENGLIISNTQESNCCDCDTTEALNALLAEKQSLLDQLDARLRTLEHT